MAFPTGTETQTTLASYIPSIWGEKVNEFFRANLTCAPFFTNRSDEVSGGGRILYTPTTTEFTAAAKSNAATVTLNSPTDTKITLTIDQWYESSFAIEDAEAAQVMHSYVLMERYAKNAGYAIAKKLDTAMTSLFSGFSGVVGSSTVNLADSDIRNAIATLESSDVPIEECEFFMSPNVFWKQVQAIDKFSLAINSPVNDPTRKAPAGYLYGRPINITTTIQYVSGTTGRYNALAHPDALHFATSPLGSGGSAANTMVGTSGIRVQSNYIPQYLSTVTTADILYGVIENRDNAGVCIVTPA